MQHPHLLMRKHERARLTRKFCRVRRAPHSRRKPHGQTRPRPATYVRLDVAHVQCAVCGCSMWVSHHAHCTITTLGGHYGLKLVIRQCRNAAYAQYRRPYRPEAEGSWALPHGEFGLDVIALIGVLRFREHRSVAEIHRGLGAHAAPLCRPNDAGSYISHGYKKYLTLNPTPPPWSLSVQYLQVCQLPHDILPIKE